MAALLDILFRVVKWFQLDRKSLVSEERISRPFGTDTSRQDRKGPHFFGRKIVFHNDAFIYIRYISNIILNNFTKNPANDVIKPSLVSSHAPPNSSSSIDWKLVKYRYITPPLTRKNLWASEGDLRNDNEIDKKMDVPLKTK